MTSTTVPSTTAPAFDYLPAGDPLAPFSLRPRYQREGDPIPADELGGEFSVDRLAVYFGLPGLTRDLYPVAPWIGVDRVRHAPPRPDGSSDPGEFAERLQDSVERAIAGHEVVAVAGSGGMDSAALIDLAARLCRRDGRRLVVAVVDLADDAGRRTLSLVQRQLAYLHVDAELLAVPIRPSRWAEPPWQPDGPRFDAWPRMHTGLVATVAEAGATVLIQGNGADQLLQTPPYLRARLIRDGGLRAVTAYQRDFGGGGQVPAELLSTTGRISGGIRTSLYWATAWPGFATDRGAPVLAPEREAAVRSWLGSFQAASQQAISAVRPTWAEATIMQRLFPYDRLADGGDLPEAMPFFDPEFARYAYHLPAASRYAPEQPNAYLRGKGLIARLLPQGFDTVLAPRRQRCYNTYRRYWQAVAREPESCVELGLIRADWRAHCRDAFDLSMIMSCETWIRGALERGASPVTAQ